MTTRIIPAVTIQAYSVQIEIETDADGWETITTYVLKNGFEGTLEELQDEGILVSQAEGTLKVPKSIIKAIAAYEARALKA